MTRSKKIKIFCHAALLVKEVDLSEFQSLYYTALCKAHKAIGADHFASLADESSVAARFFVDAKTKES